MLNKITKFGKVPLDRKVLILNKDRNWGYGVFFRWMKDSMGEKADRKIYCNYQSPEQTWLGERKDQFIAWMEFPKYE